MKNILAAFADNTVFANIVLLMIMVGGAMALHSMRRENFPEFSVDKILIQVAYPGADPEEVEEGIVLKLEEALEGIEGIKQYTTTSAENMGTALVDVQEGSDVTEVLDDVKSKVDAVSTFPVDAEKPVTTEVTMRNSVLLLALSGEMSEKQLKGEAERLRDEIRALDGISQVDTFGTRDYEISIEVSEEQLRRCKQHLHQFFPFFPMHLMFPSIAKIIFHFRKSCQDVVILVEQYRFHMKHRYGGGHKQTARFFTIKPFDPFPESLKLRFSKKPVACSIDIPLPSGIQNIKRTAVMMKTVIIAAWSRPGIMGMLVFFIYCLGRRLHPSQQDIAVVTSQSFLGIIFQDAPHFIPVIPAEIPGTPSVHNFMVIPDHVHGLI
ncbi:MAG: efflux RND transporter permease subunit [Candidatus Electrothrix sp. EH2]|nr:efflux RND transporter permease subunit [Candidatus Electrothrix sp. EH2]